MRLLDTENSIVLIIDIQDKLLNAVYNKDLIEKNTLILSKALNALEIPVIVTEQYPKGLGETISVVKESLPENTCFFEKTSFSALDKDEILDCIKNFGRKQVVVLGIETHICVSQTVAALCDLGYEVFVIKDCCSSRTEFQHHAGLERMKDNGAHIVTTEIALFEWLRGSKHPKFKEIQTLIK